VSYAYFHIDKLHFVIVDQGSPLPFSDNVNLYFTTDESFLYTPLKDDYGPLNLGLLYKYCKLLKEKIEVSITILRYQCAARCINILIGPHK
jgi:hypothetical protein